MHIIQITDDFPPRIGGMAAHAWELSKALVALGHDVTVITNVLQKIDNRRFRRELPKTVDGVKIIHLGYPLIVKKYKLGYQRHRTRQLIKRIRRTNPNTVIHLHEYQKPAYFREVAAGVPIVFTNHSSMFLDAFERSETRDHLKAMVRGCDLITAPSMELRDKSVALGYPDDRATYIPNGVDIERFHPPSGKPRRLTVGGRPVEFADDSCVLLCARRFVFKNGLHVYLDALESIQDELAGKCTVVFAGNDPSRDKEYGREILDRIDKLSARIDCRVLGPIPNEEMVALYQAADISVLPSLMEATSITGLESMAVGLPIIGTNIGGIPEIVVDGETGLLCPSNDPRGLALTIQRLVTDAGLRQKLGSQARRHVEEHFSWESIARRFVDVYSRALDQTHATAPTSNSISS